MKTLLKTSSVFSFEDYVQALLEGSVPALLDVEDSVLGAAGVRMITVGLCLFAVRPCSKSADELHSASV